MVISYFIRTNSKSQKKDVNIRMMLRDGRTLRLYATTPLSLPQRHWNPKPKNGDGNIRKNSDFFERELYQNQLDELKSHVKSAYYRLKDEPSSEWLKECIDEFFHPKRQETDERPITLFEFIEDYIDASRTRINPKTGRRISVSTIKKYTTCFNLLQEFSQYRGRSFDFQDIDLKFYTGFVKFLNQKVVHKGKDEEGNDIKETGLAVNTIGKQIAVLKGFLNEATEQGYNRFSGHKSKKFTILTEDSEAIYLNETELEKLFKLDLSNNQRLDRIRDLFLVGCWTGCRFSDFSSITPEQIKNGFLHVEQEKTGANVVIPLHPVVESILHKYDGNLPPAPSNQKFNDYIKEVCEVAQLNEEIRKGITRGGSRVVNTFKKSELVSSHTARRSFATNLYKSGFPAISIMKITGHTTEKSFLKYIKVTPDEHARLLAEHWKKFNNTLTDGAE